MDGVMDINVIEQQDHQDIDNQRIEIDNDNENEIGNGQNDDKNNDDLDEIERFGETSKAGLRRMRKLAAEIPYLPSSPKTYIHPKLSQLIYPSPNPSTYQGYLTSSIFSSSHPKPFITPSILSPGKQLFLSPNGEWSIVFHPNILTNNPINGSGEDILREGGTLAIYLTGKVLSPLNNSTNIVPISTFQLNSEPLSIIHLYPPQVSLPLFSIPRIKSKYLGPKPIINNGNISNGPSFLVLLNDSILYFYSQLIPIQNGNIPTSYKMTFLKSPLNSKFHSSIIIAPTSTIIPEQANPVSIVNTQNHIFKIKKGWFGLILENQGIWLGYQTIHNNEIGINKIEVGLDKFGKHYIQSTPMPTLPRIERMPFDQNTNCQFIQEELQGIIFVPLDSMQEEGNIKKEDKMQIDNGVNDEKVKETEKVGAVLIFNDTAIKPYTSTPLSRTRIQVHSFERKKIELAQGFSDIASGNGDVVSSWDWSTVSHSLHHYLSPENTSIIAIHPLPSIPPHSSALAVISQPAGMSVVHLNLMKDQWTILGEPIDLGELKGEVDLDLSVGPSVARGQLGLIALTGKETGPTLLIVPRLEGQPTLAESITTQSLAIDAATAIILAERDGVDWSEVVRAVIGSVGAGKRKDLISELNDQVYTLSKEDINIDELNLLLKVQIALFSLTNDSRLELASDILRLKEASHLIDRCAIFKTDGKITFDLDCIWPLIGILEWCIETISSSMREIILLGGQMEFESGTNDGDDGNNEEIDLDQFSSIILIIQPQIRKIVIKILSQFNQLTIFINNLDKPILQPESKLLPNSNQNGNTNTESLKRDAMATIVARDRINDITYKYGLNLFDWGKNLEQVSTKGITNEQLNSLLYNLSFNSSSSSSSSTSIKPNLISSIIDNLPNSSELFLSVEQSQLLSSSSSTSNISKHSYGFDAITYLPISTLHQNNEIRCSRCHNVTIELNSLYSSSTSAILLNNSQGQGENSTSVSPWNKWKLNLKKNCLCGGVWQSTREQSKTVKA
ncbi:uncharacterized protein L201_006093 [Kwoniella dendrophila CBS 6074]|uniref:Mediator complex subunit 16 C-terminal domain-containing protein n=1 Tax=Kwoniella dendrophila CBS 6074 TaxID=1295534 RepID=A0AAX4K2P8_9TREE